MTDLVTTQLAQALKATNNTALQALIDTPRTDVAKKKDRTTVAQRKDKLRQSLEAYDVDRLLELQEKMSSFIDLISKPLATNGHRVMDGTQATEMMKRFLDQREIDELTTVVRDLVREAVFGHIDALLESEGIEDPEAHNGVIEVPEFGKKFSREGAGYGAPDFDLPRLKGLLGDRWSEVADIVDVPEEVIPAHTDEVFSLDKALKLSQRDTKVMEVLRDCLVPGALKTARLWVRDL